MTIKSLTIEEFRRDVAALIYTDYDGVGYPGVAGIYDSKLPIKPSRLDKIPSWASRIYWMNK